MVQMLPLNKELLMWNLLKATKKINEENSGINYIEFIKLTESLILNIVEQ